MISFRIKGIGLEITHLRAETEFAGGEAP